MLVVSPLAVTLSPLHPFSTETVSSQDDPMMLRLPVSELYDTSTSQVAISEKEPRSGAQGDADIRIRSSIFSGPDPKEHFRLFSVRTRFERLLLKKFMTLIVQPLS